MKTILLSLLFLAFFTQSNGQDSTYNIKPKTNFNKTNPKTQKYATNYAKGNKELRMRVTLFNTKKSKYWNEDGTIRSKTTAHKALQTHPKKNKTINYLYHKNGKIASKSMLYTTGRGMCKKKWTKTYSEKGKLLSIVK